MANACSSTSFSSASKGEKEIFLLRKATIEVLTGYKLFKVEQKCKAITGFLNMSTIDVILSPYNCSSLSRKVRQGISAMALELI